MISATPRFPANGSKKLEGVYDDQGRRVSKTVFTYNAGTWALDTTKTFVYDGWSDCEEVYPAGVVVMLMAVPESESGFAGWSGGGCRDSASCEVLLLSTQTVTATFYSLPAAYLLWTQ